MPTGTKKPTSDENAPTKLVWWTIADISWRMFVPVIGLTVLGYFLDNTFGTKPWLIISLMFLGVVIAVLLVVQQYRRVTKEDK